MTRARCAPWVMFSAVVASAAATAQEDDVKRSLSPVVFFPPVPPIYGVPIDDRPERGARIYQGVRLLPPDGMADFVGEAFYPALSTRLFVPALPGTLESRLEAYRSRRQQQLNALFDQFVTLHAATPEARERELRTFAVTQSPLLVALEAEAESLRRDLVADGWRNRVDWNDGRRWKLGAITPRNPIFEAEAEFQVVRAAVYYQDGLIAEQRGLLAELAHELRLAARKARGLPAARDESDALFFSPAMARLRLPADLAPDAREKFGTYNRLKADLKRELRETVTAHDAAPAARRSAAFAALAERQWPHFGELERLADELRLLLGARLDVSPPPAPPWLPAGLIESIHSYNEDRDSYFGEMRLQWERAAEAVPRPESADNEDERLRRQQDFAARQAIARRVATTLFQEKHGLRYAELQRRYRAIREGLTVVAEKQVDPTTGRPLDADALLRRHGASMDEFATFGRETAIYTNYRLAMLQPGLSPEQRRLLFGYALVALAQPLPYGEFMPRRTGSRPVPSS